MDAGRHRVPAAAYRHHDRHRRDSRLRREQRAPLLEPAAACRGRSRGRPRASRGPRRAVRGIARRRGASDGAAAVRRRPLQVRHRRHRRSRPARSGRHSHRERVGRQSALLRVPARGGRPGPLWKPGSRCPLGRQPRSRAGRRRPPGRGADHRRRGRLATVRGPRRRGRGHGHGPGARRERREPEPVLARGPRHLGRLAAHQYRRDSDRGPRHRRQSGRHRGHGARRDDEHRRHRLRAPGSHRRRGGGGARGG